MKKISIFIILFSLIALSPSYANQCEKPSTIIKKCSKPKMGNKNPRCFIRLDAPDGHYFLKKEISVYNNSGKFSEQVVKSYIIAANNKRKIETFSASVSCKSRVTRDSRGRPRVVPPIVMRKRKIDDKACTPSLTIKAKYYPNKCPN